VSLRRDALEVAFFGLEWRQQPMYTATLSREPAADETAPDEPQWDEEGAAAGAGEAAEESEDAATSAWPEADGSAAAADREGISVAQLRVPDSQAAASGPDGGLGGGWDGDAIL